jgi:hypothetical protein
MANVRLAVIAAALVTSVAAGCKNRVQRAPDESSLASEQDPSTSESKSMPLATCRNGGSVDGKVDLSYSERNGRIKIEGLKGRVKTSQPAPDVDMLFNLGPLAPIADVAGHVVQWVPSEVPRTLNSNAPHSVDGVYVSAIQPLLTNHVKLDLQAKTLTVSGIAAAHGAFEEWSSDRCEVNEAALALLKRPPAETAKRLTQCSRPTVQDLYIVMDDKAKPIGLYGVFSAGPGASEYDGVFGGTIDLARRSEDLSKAFVDFELRDGFYAEPAAPHIAKLYALHIFEPGTVRLSKPFSNVEMPRGSLSGRPFDFSACKVDWPLVQAVVPWVE